MSPIEILEIHFCKFELCLRTLAASYVPGFCTVYNVCFRRECMKKNERERNINPQKETQTGWSIYIPFQKAYKFQSKQGHCDGGIKEYALECGIWVLLLYWGGNLKEFVDTVDTTAWLVKALKWTSCATLCLLRSCKLQISSLFYFLLLIMNGSWLDILNLLWSSVAGCLFCTSVSACRSIQSWG